MRRSRFVLAAVAFASPASGYDRLSAEEAEQLAKPTAADRAASAARAVSELGPKSTAMRRASFWMIGSFEPAQPTFVSRGDDFEVSFEPPQLYSGLATAITTDGYLLTAAHLIRPHCWLIGHIDGRQAIVRPRVVFVETRAQMAAEFAILKIECSSLEPLPWENSRAGLSRLYASACETAPRFHRVELAGETTRGEGASASAHGRVIATNIPFWRGDSGGAVVDPQGRFVGLVMAFYLPWRTHQVSRLVFVPNREFVMSVIVIDRQKSREQQASDALIPFHR